MEYNFVGNQLHYEKVRTERKRLGLSNGIRQIDITESRYLNTYITDKITGKTYFVERDYKEYSYMGFGWFKVMLLNCNDSHRVIIYENINNSNDEIMQEINKTRNNFGFI